jgi:hypothetical protein
MSDPLLAATDAWGHFCDDLKRAGEVLLRDSTPRDEQTLAEGCRHLVRMIRAGFENAHELADPLHPELAPMVGPTLVYEGVTSDARYLHAFIDGRETYRIRGARGGAPLMEFGVYTGKMGIHELSHLVGSLTEAELKVDRDGSLEVVLAPEQQKGNWVRTTPETRYMMIRQYAHDWTQTQPARLEIQREGAEAARAPLDLEVLRDALQKTARFVQTAPGFWASISDYWAGFAVNRFVAQLDADRKTDVAPPSGHHFSCGYFRLALDEALVVTLAPDEVPYWSLELANYWYETLGYGRGGSHVNNRQVAHEPDGSVRAVISAQDPGVPNWLNTLGHREGTMIFRWSRSPDPVPPIETQLVAVDTLRAG